MSRFEYEVFKRPNYEFLQAVGWFSSSVVFFIVNTYFVQAYELNYWVIPILLSIGCYRGYQSYIQRQKNTEFKSTDNIEFITFEEIKKKFRPDALWLGYGFAWTGDVTQRLYDEFLRSPEAMQDTNVDDPNTPAGAFWIHSLSGAEKNIYRNISNFEGHTLIPGTTGAGKTRAIDIIISQLLLREDEPLIMIDPKNDEDARENMRKICKKLGRTFLEFHPAFPEKSVRIDALHSWSRVTQVADRIKALLGQTRDETFPNIIWNVINAIASCLVLVGERPSIVAFRNYMSPGQMDDLIIRAISAFAEQVDPEWRTIYRTYAARYSDDKKPSKGMDRVTQKLLSMTAFYNEYLSKHHQNLDIAELINVRLHEREHLQKLIASLFPVLSMLSSGGLSDLLSPKPDPEDERPIVTTKQIVDDKCVLWMGLDTLSDQTVGAMIGSLILSDMTSMAGARYNFGKGDTLKVNLIVDEVAEVINPPLIQMLNKSRGAGFRIFLLTQTLADISVRLGGLEHTQMAIGNINNEIVLRLKDSNTAEYFAESLPEVMVKRMGTQYQTNVGHNPIEKFGGRYGESIQEDYFAMVPAWAYKILPNFHYIANFTGGSLIKGRLPILLVEEEEGSDGN